MRNETVRNFEQKQIKKLSENKEIDDFQSGDTVKVHVRIVEGKVERIQIFEGLCIGRSNKGINTSFTVRKISNGEGVERLFPVYSPFITKVELIRRGKVRRSKLYYMRGLSGKAARIKEKKTFAHAGKSTAGKEKHLKRREERKAAIAKKQQQQQQQQ